MTDRPRSNQTSSRASRRLALCGGAVLALLAAAGCGHPSSEEVQTTDKVPVVTQPAVRGSIRALIVATGTIKPAPGAELLVTAPQPARIAEMPKGAGDRVRKGELLVRFDIPSLRADASQRRSDLVQAEARLTNARAAENRIRGLYERGIAARKELEDAQRELTDAEAAIRAASGAQSAAGALAGRETVRAPFDGVVAFRGHNPGDLVDPSATEPILRLIDPTRLQVEAQVPLAQISEVQIGSPASVIGPGSYAPEKAIVLNRPAAVDPTTATAPVRLGFAAPPSKMPVGTPVRIEIQGPERRNVVVVPAAAIVEEGSEHFLMTVDAKGIAHRRKVEVGVSAGGAAEVVSGAAPGEQVVVEGQNALPDGAATVPAPAAPAAPPSQGNGG
ncbi:MAG TPA: efflux RND transporter periplasmic adaptor subunit [Thermoanaerobaculia bacterium]|nr:efflux RND transporter periplasmic adaptor subunit [Thermoanaerobaculia bacterium]